MGTLRWRHQEVQDLLAAYALGVVPTSERRLVSDHLADCSDCRHELRAMQETVALLLLADL